MLHLIFCFDQFGLTKLQDFIKSDVSKIELSQQNGTFQDGHI